MKTQLIHRNTILPAILIALLCMILPATKGFAQLHPYIRYSYPQQQIPVELLYFNVESLGHEIVLTWDAREEWSLVGYQLERSYDAIHYERVGWVWCREISRELFYEFRDPAPRPNEICFYRLKMVDFDGTMEFSPVRIARPVSF